MSFSVEQDVEDEAWSKIMQPLHMQIWDEVLNLIYTLDNSL